MRTMVASTGATASASLLCMATLSVFRVLGAAASPLLANSRQLLPDQHVDDAATAKYGPHDHTSRLSVGCMTDDCAVAAERMVAHRGERRFRLVRRHDAQDLALVGEVKRIEPEDFAKRLDLFADRRCGFISLDRDLG